MVEVVANNVSFHSNQVSSDGYIYVGRGWEIANAYTNTSIAVCFMGDYNRHIPTERQLEGAHYLLDYGLTQQYLSHDYKLVAHNQVNDCCLPVGEPKQTLKINLRWMISRFLRNGNIAVWT